MTQKEIDFLKNITIEDVEKFYPDVIDDDFQMMKVLSVCFGFAVYGFWPAASFFVGHILLGVAKETVFKSFLR